MPKVSVTTRKLVGWASIKPAKSPRSSTLPCWTSPHASKLMTRRRLTSSGLRRTHPRAKRARPKITRKQRLKIMLKKPKKARPERRQKAAQRRLPRISPRLCSSTTSSRPPSPASSNLLSCRSSSTPSTSSPSTRWARLWLSSSRSQLSGLAAMQSSPTWSTPRRRKRKSSSVRRNSTPWTCSSSMRPSLQMRRL